VKLAPGAGVRIDYIGVGLLTVGVGALQVVLDRGQEDDWFGSSFILILSIISAIGLISLFIWEWFHKHPIVEVRLFKNLNFLGANAMMFVLGIMLFASLVAMPQFLQTLLGYTAESAGLVLSGGGLLLLFLFPIAGMLASKVQARYLIGFGWLTLSLAMYYSTQYIDLLISFGAASVVRAIQVFGLGFLFVPINLVSYVGMPAGKSNAVAGMVNFMRNIGSSIGTSLVTTVIERRAQVHQVFLVAHTTPGQPPFNLALQGLASRLAVAGLNASLAARQAYARLYRETIIQATTLAYIDLYWILAVVAAIMFLLSFLLKKNDPGAGGEVAAG
jgi:DHA2 family multidrug resistance protein